MGTNRRYAQQLDAKMDDRILQTIASNGRLQSLTVAEVELDRRPKTIDPRPRRVRAWVRFGDTPVRMTAEACMWASAAVAIRFHVGTVEHRYWVWAGAVEEMDRP